MALICFLMGHVGDCAALVLLLLLLRRGDWPLAVGEQRCQIARNGAKFVKFVKFTYPNA
jgi:hypothetical protein